MREIEQDGFITDEIYIKETPSRRGIELEQSGDGKAVPATECRYPNCEECDDYIRFRGANYCTVPMVLNKQTWRLTADLIADMRKEIDEVKEMVYDEILGQKSEAETGNYSVDEGFRFLTEEEYEALSPLNKYWYDKAVATHFSDDWKKFVGNVVANNEGDTIEIRKYAPLPKEEDEP